MLWLLLRDAALQQAGWVCGLVKVRHLLSVSSASSGQIRRLVVVSQVVSQVVDQLLEVMARILGQRHGHSLFQQ